MTNQALDFRNFRDFAGFTKLCHSLERQSITKAAFVNKVSQVCMLSEDSWTVTVEESPQRVSRRTVTANRFEQFSCFIDSVA